MAVWAVALSTMKLISHRLTPILYSYGILSSVGRKPVCTSSNHLVALPPQAIYEVIPKDVSGRTSYYPARLEFHHEPQIIRGRFNERRFGPPQSFTSASSCPWLDRRVSGLDAHTLFALFGLAFATTPDLLLNLACAH